MILLLIACASSKRTVTKRALPINENCDPLEGTCKKGDWVAKEIADCRFEEATSSKFTCKTAKKFPWLSWKVNVENDDECKPVRGTKLLCGKLGTHTRCVCSDNGLYNIFVRKEFFNRCKCQYWPPVDIRANSPAFCNSFYMGGVSRVHHWACCNNCEDPNSNECGDKTWQGGSSEDYCGKCGQNTAGGEPKYSFNCGGCTTQKSCKKICNSRGLDIIGLCWKWMDCFKECCTAKNLQ